MCAGHLHAIFGEMVVYILCPIFFLNLHSLSLSCRSYLHIPEIKPLPITQFFFSFLGQRPLTHWSYDGL